MALLNREDLLKKQELKVAKVELEDGNFVFVRQMTGRERDDFEQSLLVKTYDRKGRMDGVEQNLSDFRAKLAVRTICDESGALLLDKKDAEILSQNMAISTLEKIVEAAQELNAITEKDKAKLVKNSENGQVVASSSD